MPRRTDDPVALDKPPRETRRLPPADSSGPRNLVVLLDGTGNELGRNLSNVLKLYGILEKNERQICYNNPGVGTISRGSNWARWGQKKRGVLGLMFGYGLDDNVLGAYRFLAENWREGDDVYPQAGTATTFVDS